MPSGTGWRTATSSHHGRSGILASLSLAGKPIELSPVEIALLEAVARKAFWRLLDLEGEAQALKPFAGRYAADTA